MVLDRAGPCALHQQIADHLRQAIADGRLEPADRLPPEPDLAAALGVARGTVRHALEQLVAAGLVDRGRGRGTVVCPVPVSHPPAAHLDGPAALAAGPSLSRAPTVRAEDLTALREQVQAELGRWDTAMHPHVSELAQLRRELAGLREQLDQLERQQRRLLSAMQRLPRQRARRRR